MDRINADRSEGKMQNLIHHKLFLHSSRMVLELVTTQVGTQMEWWNGASQQQVAWCWKAGGTAVANTDGDSTSQVSANQEAGFSIVKFTLMLTEQWRCL